MSIILGAPPEPRIVSVEQSPSGTSKLILSVPMVLGESNGIQYPAPQNIKLPDGFGFRGARGKQDSSGNWSWEVSCEGGPSLSLGDPNNPTADDELVEYAFEPSDIEVPITSHPDILKLIDYYGGAVEDGRVVFREKVPKAKDGNSAIAKDLVSRRRANPMFGVEAYTSFAGTWTKSYTIKEGDILTDLFADVEKITAKPPMPSWITFTFGSRNWLKRTPKCRVVGKCLSVTERYWLSGIGGHNPAVYTGTQSGTGIQSF